MFAMSRARSGVVGRERLRVMLPIITFALFTACASGGATYSDEEPVRSNLVVENNSWGPVTVYISSSGQPWRLGAVDGSSKRTFSLDKFRSAVDAGAVYLVARPLAGNPFRSETFTFSLGGSATWTIEAAPEMSHVVLR
jgi:hypothetical protein